MLMALSDVLQLYRDAWMEHGELKRIAILSLALRTDTVIFHPLDRVVGPRALADLIGDLHIKIDFDRFEYTALPQEHERGPWVRLHWGMWVADGAMPHTEGLDVMEFDDANKIRQIISFPGRGVLGTSG